MIYEHNGELRILTSRGPALTAKEASRLCKVAPHWQADNYLAKLKIDCQGGRRVYRWHWRVRRRQAAHIWWVQVGAGHQEGRGSALGWWRQQVPGFCYCVKAPRPT